MDLGDANEPGIQTRLHFTEFRRSSPQGNTTRQREATQHDQGQHRLSSLHRNPGMFGSIFHRYCRPPINQYLHGLGQIFVIVGLSLHQK